MKQILVSLFVFLVIDRTGLWAQAVATPDTLRFGPVRTWTSVQDSVRLRNTGDADVILISGDVDNAAFQLPSDQFLRHRRHAGARPGPESPRNL